MESMSSRRKWLRQISGAAASAWVASPLASALGDQVLLRRQAKQQMLTSASARQPHHRARAKQVIMIFLTGGCSHTDSFDPKPQLAQLSEKSPRLMPSPWRIRQRGQSGIQVTDLFPNVAQQIDDLTLVRSMHGDHNNHTGATMGMHTGSVSVARPSLGAWVNYGLGSLNENLPGHIVLAKEPPYTGSLAWDSNFLPADFQGVRIGVGKTPIADLQGQPAAMQSVRLQMLKAINEAHLNRVGHDSELAARQASFDLAVGLQETAPQVLDLNAESAATKTLYGLDSPVTETFGKQCLTARRLIENGVRFVELIDVGSHDNWDKAHGNILSHQPLADAIDRPVAGLLVDLKQRGLLDDTLVVWCTEFGRTPHREGSRGRNHHNKAFTCWLAGGGVKGGYVHGATDETGTKVIEDACHTHDFHATILHLLGLDHKRLTYRHNGRDYRLTDVAGKVAKGLFRA